MVTIDSGSLGQGVFKKILNLERWEERETVYASPASDYIIWRLAKHAAHWLAMIKSRPCLICSRITTSALSASWFLNASSMAK